MIERMEEQVKNLTKSYRDELIQIEVVCQLAVEMELIQFY